MRHRKRPVGNSEAEQLAAIIRSMSADIEALKREVDKLKENKGRMTV